MIQQACGQGAVEAVGGGRGGAVENKVHLHHKIKLTDEQDFFR